MEQEPLKIYSLICSRDNQFSQTSLELFDYYKRCGIEVKSLIGFKSIFSAYNKGVNNLNLKPDDIVIFCHDDIEIKMPESEFLAILKSATKVDGFIGVAGTKNFESTGVWWNWNTPQYMSGKVIHGTKDKLHETYFGPTGRVVVLDGVFIACSARTLDGLHMGKPEGFQGDWDYYDIFYTFQAHLSGLFNRTVPIIIRHESPGQMRESWHYNRTIFIDMFKENLPAAVV
jgi:hypothetical protein